MSTFTDYLGKNASTLLAMEPFSSWKFDRSIDNDLPDQQIDYVCEVEGFSMTCDADDRIQSIFLESGVLAHAEINVPLQSGRRDVIASLGAPSKSGEPSKHNVLGEFGAWDRYDKKHYSIHIEYTPHADEIRMVTLMRSDAVPGN